jgi:hypothetical protein
LDERASSPSDCGKARCPRCSKNSVETCLYNAITCV